MVAGKYWLPAYKCSLAICGYWSSLTDDATAWCEESGVLVPALMWDVGSTYLVFERETDAIAFFLKWSR